jgi:phosphoribosylformylglycinamidine synthase subunit PurS
MFARVYVTLKKGMPDPQGRAVKQVAAASGCQGISDVRQGKYFEIRLDPELDAENARAAVEQLARDLLANPVIEEYRIEVE